MANAAKVGVICSILLILATIAGWEELEWLFYSGAALLLISYLWSRSSLISVRFERTLVADRVFAGDPVRERFRIRNLSLLPRTWVSVVDASSLPGYRPSRSVRVGSRAETTWTTETRTTQRGRYRLGPTTLESGDPFGLFDTRRTVEQTHELIVYPRIVALPNRASPGGDLSGASKRRHGRSLSSPIIRSVRQYVTGDPWNQIAWRASARHSTLLVKEFDPDPISDEWIFLDLDPVTDREARPSTELAISLAASFVLEWLDTGRDVGLLVNRTIPAIIEADAGDRQRLRILETLAVVEPLGEADPSRLIARFASKFSRATGLVIISTGNGTRFATPLGHLQRQGVPLVVIAIVPVTASGPADDWTDVEAEGIPVTRLTWHGDRIESPATTAPSAMPA